MYCDSSINKIMPSKIRKDNNKINNKYNKFFLNSHKEFGVHTDRKKILKKVFELTRIINTLKNFLSKIQGGNLNTESSTKIRKLKYFIGFLEGEIAEIKNRI